MMKNLFLLLMFAGSLIPSFCQVSTQIDTISKDLFCSEIMDSTYVIIHKFPSRCNSMFVLFPDNNGLLIDTPNETTGTKALLDWINLKFGGLELIAVNTGFHNDNLGGNEYLRSKGIRIYGSGLTASLINERADDLKAIVMENAGRQNDQKYYQAYENVTFMPPTDTFDIKKGLELTIGGEGFEVHFPGESHTNDNVVVYLSNKKILFGGCMIFSLPQQRPGYIADANMIEWSKSVLSVQDKYKDARIVVPGHGDWGTLDLLPHTIDVLNQWNTENTGQ